MISWKKENIFVILISICIVFFMSVGIGFATESKIGGVLKVAVTSSPPTIDPMVVTSTSTREVVIHIFEPLVSFDENYAVVPMLAKNWDISDNGLVYTFYLREGVPFHNGKIMKAEDAKASVERYIQVSTMRDLFDNLEEINIIDDYTIEMKLSMPTGAFLANLAQINTLLGIMPKEVVENAEPYKVDIVGTGPYELVEWIPDRHVIIKRFENYKPIEGLETSGFSGYKNAYLDEIHFIPVTEPSSREAGLIAGDYDFVDSLPGDSVPALKKMDGFTNVELMPYAWTCIYLNQSEHSVFNNLKLRQAVQAGLDHEEHMIAGAMGSGRLDPGMYFKEQIWHSNVGEELYNQNDPEKAKKLMKEAGYNNEEIVILTNTDYADMYKSSIVLEKQLKDLGFNTTLKVFDWPGQGAYRKDLKNWDLSYTYYSIRLDPTANDWYYKPESTFFGCDSPKMVEALERGERSTLFEDRYNAYSDAQRIFYDEVLMIKLFDFGVWQGYQNYVKGYIPFYMINFTNVWLDK